MTHHDVGSEVILAVGKGAPPAVVAGVTILGYTLQDWVLACTLLYTMLQIGALIHRFFKKDTATNVSGD